MAAKKKTVKKKLAPLLEIRQREGSEKNIMVGANTIVLVDGKPLRGAQAVKFEVNARGIAKATVTLIGRFNITGRSKIVKIVNKY